MDGTYTIEQAAELTGLTRHTLRYYERIGLLEPVGRAAGGHRRYQEADLGAVRFLNLLRQTGMPIRDMLRFVELTRSGDDTVPERVAVLEAHRDELCARLADLTGHLAAIENKIKWYRALLDPPAARPGVTGAVTVTAAGNGTAGGAACGETVTGAGNGTAGTAHRAAR